MAEHPTTKESVRALQPHEVDVLTSFINPDQMGSDIRRYSALHSRNVLHPHGNEDAVWMLHRQLELISADLKVDDLPFEHDGSTLYNVEARLPRRGLGGIVIVSAHLDSTGAGEPGFDGTRHRAPGADDDASGIAGVLGAAMALSQLAASADAPRRRREIRFVLFNAEEAGQAGSEVYANRARQAGERIVAVYHMDMIGFAHRAAFELHVGFKDEPSVERDSLRLARRVARMSREVGLAPQLYTTSKENLDPRQGHSDHSSFHGEGYPACLVSEDFCDGPGPKQPGNPNPFYHLREDTLANLDVEYAAKIAQAVAAAAWYTATRSR